jgi:hypothetical protein
MLWNDAVLTCSKVLSLGKLEGKRPLGRPRRRWVVNVIINLKEIGYGMDSTGS